MVFAPKSYFSSFYQKIQGPFRRVLGGGGHVKSLKIMLFPTWAGVWGRVGALGGGFGALGEAPKSIIRDAKDYLGALN